MIKRLQSIVFSFIIVAMVAFISFGYAALTDTLRLTGQVFVEGKPYQGVYIKNVEIVSTSNATNSECDYILPTNHGSTVDANRTGGSVTYKITVHNNTDVTYWYVGERYVVDQAQNSLISTNGGITIITKDRLSDTYQSFNSDDWVPAQTERDFYVTKKQKRESNTDMHSTLVLTNFM